MAAPPPASPMTPAAVEAVAAAFCANLLEDIGPAKLAMAVARNAAEPDPNVCHTHDFMDANEAMLDAMESVLGRPSWLPSDVEEGLCSEDQLDSDFSLWNDAWGLAKSRGFKGA